MKEKRNKHKTPWPTEKAMIQVYENRLWGTNHTKFYSGEGSHKDHLVQPYLDVVSAFLSSFEQLLTVCDLGCGDFNVGRELVSLSRKYIAVDIVPALIDHNRNTFKNENLEFCCLDIAKDTLPKADCVLVRQVLQHLSNVEITEILQKLYQYKYVILTEHIPSKNFTPNLDIISGQGTRLKKGSGVDVLLAPFYFKMKESRELISVPLADGGGVIKTICYSLF